MSLAGGCGTLEGLPTTRILALLGPGLLLPTALGQPMEDAFGADFGRVRVHFDAVGQHSRIGLGQKPSQLESTSLFDRADSNRNRFRDGAAAPTRTCAYVGGR